MLIDTFKELNVYKSSIDGAMKIFEITKRFPSEEKYSMTDQIRRYSRSVSANLGEAWRRRRYRAAFISKLNDCESEASETQVWLEIAQRCKYITEDEYDQLDAEYNHIIGQLVRMVNNVEKWIIKDNK